jgi:hypothetical protein
MVMIGRVNIIDFLESRGRWKPDINIILKNILEQLTESIYVIRLKRVSTVKKTGY